MSDVTLGSGYIGAVALDAPSVTVNYFQLPGHELRRTRFPESESARVSA